MKPDEVAAVATGQEVLCPWSWLGFRCALDYAHPKPHQLIGEQPQFAKISDVVDAAREWRDASDTILERNNRGTGRVLEERMAAAHSDLKAKIARLDAHLSKP